MRILGLVLILFLSSCALTYETPHRCELMQRGQPCLSDHTCCKPPTTYYYNTYPNYYNWWWKVNNQKYTIHQFPMTISGRSHGSTKMELKHAIRSFFMMLRLFVKIKI